MKIEFRPVGPVLKTFSPSLSDILAHTNAPYQSEDKVTVAHESTHGVNNDIANKFGTRSKNVGLYCLNNLGFTIPEPHLTISEVSDRIPESFRGFTPYQLYLKSNGPEYWNNQPLYLADEWVAYTNGAQVALELSNAGQAQQFWSEVQNSVLFTAYVGILCYMLHERGDLGEELKEFYSFQSKRANGIYAQANHLANMKHADTTRLMFEWENSKYAKLFERLESYGTGEYL